MRLLSALIYAFLAACAFARQASPVQWDKYASERGFAGNVDPMERGSVEARDADPEAVQAWEQEHGGSAPAYKAYADEDVHSHLAGGAASHEQADSNVEDKIDGAWKPDAHHFARTIEEAYDQAREAKHYGPNNGHGSHEAHNYARQAPASNSVRLFVADSKLPVDDQFDPHSQAEHEDAVRNAPAPRPAAAYGRSGHHNAARNVNPFIHRPTDSGPGVGIGHHLHAREARRPAEFGHHDVVNHGNRPLEAREAHRPAQFAHEEAVSYGRRPIEAREARRPAEFGHEQVVNYKNPQQQAYSPKSAPARAASTHSHDEPAKVERVRINHTASKTAAPRKTGRPWLWSI